MSDTRKKRRPKVTDKQKEFIKKHYGKLPAREIAEKAGVDITAVYRYAPLSGKTRGYDRTNRSPGSVFTDEQRELIHKLAAQGMKPRAVAKEAGTNFHTTAKYMYQKSLVERNKAPKVVYDCNPPYDCFECSYPDCIAASSVPVTEEEAKFIKIGSIDNIKSDRLGGIDTVGQGNGRRRV